MKGLGLRRRRSPAASPFPEGWLSQAVLRQLSTRKLPPGRGPHCPARARGGFIFEDGEEVAAAPASQVGRSLGRCLAGVESAGRVAAVLRWPAQLLSEAT